jgi:transcriptional regulator with XRE-family HTH domain
MEHERPWAAREAAGIGERIAHFRRSSGLTAQELADRCAALGLPSISRVVIAKLETGKREAVSTAELLVLAAALRTAPVVLLFPLLLEDTTEVLPGVRVHPSQAIRWFSGLSPNPDAPDRPGAGFDRTTDPMSPALLWRDHEVVAENVRHIHGQIDAPDARPDLRQEHAQWLAESISELRRIRAIMRAACLRLPPVDPVVAREIGEEDQLG